MNNYYSSDEAKLRTTMSIDKTRSNINICYYPFIEYQNMTMNEQKQVWKGNFCSPSYGLLYQTPALKTQHEKDAFCYANGGRVANIPEIMGIIKSFGSNRTGQKFWIGAIKNLKRRTTKPKASR